jgi:hypothetical protein
MARHLDGVGRTDGEVEDFGELVVEWSGVEWSGRSDARVADDDVIEKFGKNLLFILKCLTKYFT